MSDPIGETTWEYDPLNQVREQTVEIQGVTYTTRLDYDKAGNRTGVFYPHASDWLRYTFTSHHQVQGIAGVIDEIRYDAAGNRTHMRRTNGVVSSYTAERRHRPDMWHEVAPPGGGGPGNADILRLISIPFSIHDMRGRYLPHIQLEFL